METNTHNTNGSAWAAILAAGMGCAAFGLLADLSEASKTCSHLLNFYIPSGDLSGKSTVAIVFWLIIWGILYATWKQKEIARTRPIAIFSIAMIFLALVMTFPPFFGLLG